MSIIQKAIIELDGEWPSQSLKCIYMERYKSKNDWAVSSSRLNALFSKEQFEAKADRMRGKPDWKDAPEWAKYLFQNKLGQWCWFEHKPLFDNSPVDGFNVVISKFEGKVIGDWRKTLEKRPEHIGDVNENADPAPAKTWFDAGEQPPVGCSVELVWGGKNHGEVEIVAYRCDKVIFWRTSTDSVDCAEMPTAAFRPIRTEREKVIDAADEVIRKTSSAVDDVALNALYDAGLLRLPEAE